MAWRVRDLLAAHPLLGGALAQINVCAGYETICLEGWACDDEVRQLALRLAMRAAGRRAVDMQIQVRCSAHRIAQLPVSESKRRSTSHTEDTHQS
jgi:hypothetical protein